MRAGKKNSCSAFKRKPLSDTCVKPALSGQCAESLVARAYHHIVRELVATTTAVDCGTVQEMPSGKPRRCRGADDRGEAGARVHCRDVLAVLSVRLELVHRFGTAEPIPLTMSADVRF